MMAVNRPEWNDPEMLSSTVFFGVGAKVRPRNESWVPVVLIMGMLVDIGEILNGILTMSDFANGMIAVLRTVTAEVRSRWGLCWVKSNAPKGR